MDNSCFCIEYSSVLKKNNKHTLASQNPMMPNGQYCQMQCFHSCVYIEKKQKQRKLSFYNMC